MSTLVDLLYIPSPDISANLVDMVAKNATISRLVPYVKGGIPELHFARLLGTLKPPVGAALPDPWSGKSCSLWMQGTTPGTGTLIFTGDVSGYVDRWMDGYGWVREYRAPGLVNRANYIPVTDGETLTDTSVWNLPGDDPNFIGSRAGQTVGQIVQAILQMSRNMTALSAAGIGNYSSGLLPSITLADLAGLTILPPWVVRISGERILQSLENFIQSCHPNHFIHVDPSGYIRVFDTRTFSPNTLTIGGDPRVGMPMLTRDFTDCYSQMEIRGNTLVTGMTLQTMPWPGSGAPDGGLQEDFAHDGLSNAAAKAAWVPSDWSQPNQYGAPFDTGTCSEPDTTHVVVHSANASMTWSADQLNQANGLGNIVLLSDALAGLVTQQFQARIVANTALTAGGSSTLTLDTALPATSYQSYNLFALALGANVVGRRYKVTNAAVAAALQNFFPYPFAYVNSQGSSASLTSTPVGTVMWSAFGSGPPYNTGYDGVTVDPVNGLIYFDKPTQVVANGLSTPVKFADNVQAFVPVAYGTLTAYAPSPSTYAGTLFTVEGIQRTKVITVLEWKDYSNQTNMHTFASEYLDSVKDVVVEGTLPYLGLDSTFWAPGQAVSIAGTSGITSYTTGWESLSLPVVSMELAFNTGPQGTSYTTTLHLSNRRGRYSCENFLRPNITGAQFGGGTGEPFGASPPTFGAPGASQPPADNGRRTTDDGRE